MSPRRHRRRSEVPSGLDEQRARRGIERVLHATDGAWAVRHLSGEGTAKTYRCPGCDQEIRPGVPHLVVWPADERGDPEDRRHWHAACFEARQRRTPPVFRRR